jgi:hypothetical protein
MPEQNTPAPIRREDIRKGDLIRIEWAPDRPSFNRAIEFVAEDDKYTNQWSDGTFFRLNRPGPLPKVPGVYLDKDTDVWQVHNSGRMVFLCEGESDDDLDPAKYAPFTLLRPTAQIAAEVLADVRNIFGGPDSGALLHKEVDKIAAKFGVVL